MAEIAQPPTPPQQRRPRVREVRWRFTSPVVSSSSPSPGDLHLPGSRSPVVSHAAADTRQQQQQQQRQQQRSVSARRRLDFELPSHADESRSEVTRSLDTPLLGAGPQSKGKKVLSRASRPETPIVSTSMDIKLLHNHYLQWRFANAKAEATMQAQKREAEEMLFSLTVKLGDLYNSVMRKRAELGMVQRAKAVSAILESQVPHLDEWSAFEGDYLASLSEVTQALSNASIQLPISGNVRADVREVEEALNSSMKIMDAIASRVESIMLKAEQLQVFISELARVVSRERVVIEESGDLLSKRYLSLVEECSLRGQIIQFH